MKNVKRKKVKSSTSINTSKKINSKKQNLQKVDSRIWAILFIVLVLIISVIVSITLKLNGKVITGMAGNTDISSSSSSPTNVVENAEWEAILVGLAGTSNINPTIPLILRAIFGPAVKIKQDSERNAALSAVVLTLCVWFLIFLTFSDILSTFSTFSKGISWGLGAVFATIMAQFNWQMKAMLWLARFTGVVGGVLTFAGILGAFAAFAVVNLGILPFIKNWALKRQAAVTGMKMASSATNVGNTIKALNTIGKSLSTP